MFFQVTSSQKFDIFIMLIILLNMTTMAIEHYDMSEGLENALYWINQLFVFIFTCECVMKLLGLRQYYFKQPWNVFDFVVVISSVLSKQRLKIYFTLHVNYKALWFKISLSDCHWIYLSVNLCEMKNFRWLLPLTPICGLSVCWSIHPSSQACSVY